MAGFSPLISDFTLYAAAIFAGRSARKEQT